MTNKYIIRNCPALYQINGMTNECLGTDYQCQERTDCVLKRIVELCKDEQQSRVATNILSNKILKLIDIEECE